MGYWSSRSVVLVLHADALFLSPPSVLFPRHTNASARDNTINLIHTFRDYLHYHIKCSKVRGAAAPQPLCSGSFSPPVDNSHSCSPDCCYELGVGNSRGYKKWSFFSSLLPPPPPPHSPQQGGEELCLHKALPLLLPCKALCRSRASAPKPSW